MPRYIDTDKICYHFLRVVGHSEPEMLVTEFEINAIPTADVAEIKHGKWVVRHRHEHYPRCKPYDENVCPFCRRADHNGDGMYCGYCGAKMDVGDDR